MVYMWVLAAPCNHVLRIYSAERLRTTQLRIEPHGRQCGAVSCDVRPALNQQRENKSPCYAPRAADHPTRARLRRLAESVGLLRARRSGVALTAPRFHRTPLGRSIATRKRRIT